MIKYEYGHRLDSLLRDIFINGREDFDSILVIMDRVSMIRGIRRF